MTLDIVIPCYNEQECVPLIYAEIKRIMSCAAETAWSVIYIDDGSSDNTLNEILALAQNYDNVKYISLSRNFGKEAAIYAGLEASHSDFTVIMDADGQDPPELLPVMLGMLDDDCDCIAARRTSRTGEPPVRSWFANRFYALINMLSDVKIEASARDYRMMKARVRESVLRLVENERFSKGLFPWVGFKVKWLDVPNANRMAGKTKWSFFKLFKYAVSGIVSFSTAPLRIASFLGVILVAAAFTYFIYRIARYGILAIPTDEITIILLLTIGGTIILLLGIIGEYIARIYNESKRRPIYLTRKSNIDDM